MIKKIQTKSEFTRNVLTLMTGATIAQAIPVAISPILTRIYTPEDFGILALYLSIVSILGIIITFRYELAIVQPKEDKDAIAIVVLSLVIASTLSFICLIFIFFFNQQINQIIGTTDLGWLIYIIPASLFLTGFLQSLNYWHVRQKNYRTLAFQNVIKGSTMSASQILLGLLKIPYGLILSYIVGFIVSLLILFNKFNCADKERIKSIKKTQISKNAKKYQKFPKFSIFGALADTVSVQMPILILSRFYGAYTTGMFSLVFRVLNLPMSLISKALSQVLFQKISEFQHQSPLIIKIFVIKLFSTLFFLMIPFVLLIWFFGEPLFVFIFGDKWAEAGSMAGILVFAMAIRFIVSPLSVILTMERNIKLGVLWQFVYLITATTTLYLFRKEELRVFLTAFTIHEIILYLFYFLIILKGVKVISTTT